MLTDQDLKQIEEHGSSRLQVEQQLKTFEKGIPFTHVITAATIDNGITHLSQKEEEKLVSLYEKKKDTLELVKFVPASGAATRMFRFLHTFLSEYDPEDESFAQYCKRTDNKAAKTFFDSLKHFPFTNEVRRVIRQQYDDYKNSQKGPRAIYYAKALLTDKGLKYADKPKGLVPFHKYTKYSATAFEEQLYEAAFYAAARGKAFLHFTFSEEHLNAFRKEFHDIKNRVEKKTKTEFHISYSFQEKATDTIAATPTNEPFRDEEGNLVFRPGGHGALIKNLNEVDADVVFIKNIDNVVAEPYVEDIAHYKKMLGGKLLSVQQQTFTYLKALSESTVSKETINDIKAFLWNELNCKDIPDTPKELYKKLHRPIRVCGVVKNTGAPGGGPFWVIDSDGSTTLQIVETAQIDLDNATQQNTVQTATHFNPVDIVCGVRDHTGKKYDLEDFVNNKAGFISQKSLNGKPLKAMELPGLWNGGMAYWNTIFVEVPLQTFNPVKTVNDLLNREHQPNL
ncbi:DUF4301 family protein [Luteirhabdus pelagi]|uniref:DUF4301 family protein n=1 Tax=Luteirhabdus pelagi TaxID=2792783 RepID=UPI00193A361E|nr:DUF4301 family protein [Luteirhabdus pelagi]